MFDHPGSSQSSAARPRVRPVEAFPVEQDGEPMVLVQDPSGLASGPLLISPPGLFILSLMDGQNSFERIDEVFATQFGQPLPRVKLENMIQRLDEAHYLDSETFAVFYQSLVDEYRSSPTRVSGDAASFGADGNDLDALLRKMLGQCPCSQEGAKGRRLAGLIAPHLDYARGGTCYANAYAALADAVPSQRFVILGTNHFGRATSVVATGKDFQTPLGTTATDRRFLDVLQERCGRDLCEHEFDHRREHSVELQVLILQHLFGAENFEIVPVLCHDPCGPTGTKPYDGNGVDLRVFSETLGKLIREDDTPTTMIASADLSHVGRRFGDANDLETQFLSDIERKDRELLDCIVAGRRDDLITKLTERDNNTRVCSTGCMYALMAALPKTKAKLLEYDQAADPDSGTGVTCSAVAFWET